MTMTAALTLRPREPNEDPDDLEGAPADGLGSSSDVLSIIGAIL